jgi:hypothetical protein
MGAVYFGNTLGGQVMGLFKQLLRRALSSTKFLTLVATAAAGILAKKGFDVPTEEIVPYLQLVVGWLVGQGLADFGKNKNGD